MLTGVLAAANGLAEPVPLFDATYKVRYGLLRGEMTLQLRRDDDSGYTYETSLRPRGLVSVLRRGAIDESTTLEIGNGTLKPLDYRSKDTIARPPRETIYRFDEPKGRVTGTYKGRPVDEAMRPGGHNRISAHVAVMLALNSDQDLSSIAVFDRARWRDFRFEVIEGHAVSTPIGDFDTVEIRYTSTRKSRSWSLHCAAALDYVPVMIVYREDGRTKSTAKLKELRLTGNDSDIP